MRSTPWTGLLTGGPLVDEFTALTPEFDDQRHLSDCVGGAGEAGVVGPNGDLDAIEQPQDFELARLVLARYIKLEEDEARREEARELLAEANLQLGDDAEAGVLESVDDADDMEEEEVPQGFGLEDQAAEEPGWDEEDDGLDEEELEADESEGRFVASLNLELTGMKATCSQCAAAIPADAPYCYNCKMPHFYEER